jgi:hypothetical protein
MWLLFEFPPARGVVVPCRLIIFFGGHSEGDPPVPIPNTEVKPLSADGTAWETMWESRSPPNSFFIEKRFLQKGNRFFLPGARQGACLSAGW